MEPTAEPRFVRVNLKLPADLHRKAKIRAAERDQTLQGMIESLLKDAIEGRSAHPSPPSRA